MSDESPVVVVLGSKPESLMPAVKPHCVVSANGAASKAIEYRSMSGVTAIAMVSSRQLMKPEVLARVIELRPHEVVMRFKRPDAAKLLADHLPACRVSELSTSDQYQLQRPYFGWRFRLAHYTYVHSKAYQAEIGLLPKLKGWLREMSNLEFGGVSTGSFAVVYALERWPTATVIMSGIGLESGPHHYGNGRFSSKVAVRDRRLMPHMHRDAKRRLLSTDRAVCETMGIEQWRGPSKSFKEG